MGGFDLDAAQEVCGGGELPRHQILDQLTLLVDKSLVVAESASGRTRYRLLETIRQYAMEKLGESGEADVVRDAPPRLLHVDRDRSSMRSRPQATSPFWRGRRSRSTICVRHSRGASSTARWNARSSSCRSLYPLWLLRGRPQEGLAWFETAFADMDDPEIEVDAAVRARALADNAVLGALTVNTSGIAQAEEALAIARELDDPTPSWLARSRLASVPPLSMPKQRSRMPPRRSTWRANSGTSGA